MIQIILLDNGVRVANIDYPNNHLVFGIERTNIIEIFDSGKKVVSAPYTEFINESSQPFLTPESVITALELSYVAIGDVTQEELDIEIATRAATDTALDLRTTTLENNEYKTLYFETISASTGTITKPTNSTILLDQFYSGGDAIVETLVNGQPSGQSPLTSGGSVVSVSSFDINGNYTLSGTPSSFDVALLYILTIKAIDYGNIVKANELNREEEGVVKINATQTLTNKRIPKRILVVTQSATPSTNIDNGDIIQITGLAQAITSMTTNLTGTPYDGQMIMWQITDNGTARAITWGASFASTTGSTLPTTTVISTMLRVITQYNLATSKHECQYVN